MMLHKFITLLVDVMFVDRTGFLISVARGVKFITAEHVPYRTAKQLSLSIKQILQL